MRRPLGGHGHVVACCIPLVVIQSCGFLSLCWSQVQAFRHFAIKNGEVVEATPLDHSGWTQDLSCWFIGVQGAGFLHTIRIGYTRDSPVGALCLWCFFSLKPCSTWEEQVVGMTGFFWFFRASRLRNASCQG